MVDWVGNNGLSRVCDDDDKKREHKLPSKTLGHGCIYIRLLLCLTSLDPTQGASRDARDFSLAVPKFGESSLTLPFPSSQSDHFTSPDLFFFCPFTFARLPGWTGRRATAPFLFWTSIVIFLRTLVTVPYSYSLHRMCVCTSYLILTHTSMYENFSVNAVTVTVSPCFRRSRKKKNCFLPLYHPSWGGEGAPAPPAPPPKTEQNVVISGQSGLDVGSPSPYAAPPNRGLWPITGAHPRFSRLVVV